MLKPFIFLTSFLMVTDHTFASQTQPNFHELSNYTEILIDGAIVNSDLIDIPSHVTVHITPQQQGLSIELIETNKIDNRVKQHVLALASQIRIEELPKDYNVTLTPTTTQQTQNTQIATVVDQLSSNVNAPFYSVYYKTYHFINAQPTVVKKFSKNLERASYKICQILKSDDSIKPLKKDELFEFFELNFILKLDANGDFSVDLSKPQLKEPLKTAIIKRLGQSKLYPVYNLSNKKYTAIYYPSQPVNLSCPILEKKEVSSSG